MGDCPTAASGHDQRQPVPEIPRSRLRIPQCLKNYGRVAICASAADCSGILSQMPTLALNRIEDVGVRLPLPFRKF